MKMAEIDQQYNFYILNVSNHNWFTLHKCLPLSNAIQMFLSHCRKKSAGGMIPSISWSLWVTPILILEWTANWQASSFLMMGSVTWTARMNTPCQPSWCVICTLHCFQGYKKANEAIMAVGHRITHTWCTQSISWFEMNRFPCLNLTTLRGSRRSTGGWWGYVISLDLL